MGSGGVQTMSILGTSLETTLTNLISSTTYMVQVAAMNNAGTGVYSNNLSQMTLGMYIDNIGVSPWGAR